MQNEHKSEAWKWTFFANLSRNMIASKLVNILFQNVLLYT